MLSIGGCNVFKQVSREVHELYENVSALHTAVISILDSLVDCGHHVLNWYDIDFVATGKLHTISASVSL